MKTIVDSLITETMGVSDEIRDCVNKGITDDVWVDMYLVINEIFEEEVWEEFIDP